MCSGRIEKKVAAAVERKKVREMAESIEERSLHSTARLLRRSEAEKKMRRAVPVGMTGVASRREWSQDHLVATKGKTAKSRAAKKNSAASELPKKTRRARSKAAKKKAAGRSGGGKRMG